MSVQETGDRDRAGGPADRGGDGGDGGDQEGAAKVDRVSVRNRSRGEWIMTEDIVRLVFGIFATATVVVYIYYILKISLRVARKNFDEWDDKCSVIFFFTIGQFGQSHINRWMRLGVKNHDSAVKIIKQQNLIILLMLVGFVSICLIYLFLAKIIFGNIG
ncbi:hypothetical protein [Xanthobacter sp. KR7-225]|uniref:hypothetical protein n=1 Tax=Xanthobacter sp. KR7-225 TaxID=3156613 RepID=UPI0032B616C5